jgi:hypothetical protein
MPPMLILWTDQGRECVARFTIADEARNFIALLRSRHGVQAVELLDEDAVPLEHSVPAT